jgi:group I intron endonuclease
MDTIMIIYKTTNLINRKIYIGKDKHNDPKYLGSGKSLHYAIKKYGRENFQKEILEYCESENHMAEREMIWIHKFNSTDRTIGYNMTEGGAGGNTRINYTKHQLDEYKTKLSTGVRNSEKYTNSVKNKTGISRPEHSKKLKELYAIGKIIPHNLGKVPSEETRRKISAANSGKTLSEGHRDKIASSKYKAIDQFDINGIFIKTYQSIKHASDENNTGRDSIYGCCIGKYKQGGGYKWKYSDIKGIK